MELPAYNNTAIVIVTFNPDNSFLDNLSIHFSIARYVIVVDNGSITSVLDLISSVCCDQLIFLPLDTNRGIAFGLNVGINKALDLGCDWIVTFDQDSTPNEKILGYYSTVLSQVENVGLIGTSYSPILNEITSLSWKETNTIITSGMLHCKSIFSFVGFYDENLFIDSVDFDFLLRTRLKKYTVLRVNEALICHKLGFPVKKCGIESSNHSALRRFYIARNHVIMTKRYFFKFPYWIIKKNCFFCYSLFCMAFVEGNRIEKVKKTIKGLVDGIKMH